MNPVILLDIISSASIIFSLLLLFTNWHKSKWLDSTTAILLTLMALFLTSNFLELFNNDIIDPYESFSLPMAWLFFFFTNMNKQRIIELNIVKNELTRSNRIFNLVTDTIQEVFWLESPDLDEQIFVNSNKNSTFGDDTLFSLSEIRTAHYWYKTLPAEKSSQLFQIIKDKVSLGQSYKLEYQIKTENDNTRWILEKGYPVKNESGKTEMIAGICSNITDRKKIEINLQKNEEKMRIMLFSIADAVITTDTEGKIDWLNKTAEKLTGWSTTEATGRPVTEVFCVSLPNSNYLNPAETVLQTGKTTSLASGSVLLSKNGTQYHIVDSAAPIKDDQGNTHGVVIVFTNISTTYSLQQDIRDSKERLELALSGARLGTWDLNIPSGKVIYNNRFASILGYSIDEINPDFQFLLNLIHPDDYSSVMKALTDHLVGSTAYFENEFRLQSKSGDWIWILTKGKVIQRDFDGQPLRACGILNDITKAKKSQQEMETYLNKITEQKQFIQTIFETSPNYLYVYDIKTNQYIYQNQFISFLTGFSFDQITNMGEKLIHPDDLPEIKILLDRLRNSSDHQIVQAEYRVKSKSGVWLWFHSYNTPFKRDFNKSVVQILGVSMDVTKQKEFQQKLMYQQEKLSNLNDDLISANNDLDIANKRLKELDILKNEFISIASHELRTPVTSVLGFAQTLLTPGLNISEPKRDQYLKIIEKEAIRLGKLINNLLDITSIESGQGELEMRCIALDNLAKGAVASLNPPPEKQVILINDEKVQKQVYCNRDQISQVFVNILDNALRYGDEVIVSIGEDKSKVLVSIKDNGPGIAKHQLKVIFEKFYRIEGEQKPGGGSGLGLSIAKDIITAHGGQIWAESTLGKGSTFFFTLNKCK